MHRLKGERRPDSLAYLCYVTMGMNLALTRAGGTAAQPGDEGLVTQSGYGGRANLGVESYVE